jgi:hypothetical protein
MKDFGVEEMDGFEEGSHIRNYRWSRVFESLNFPFAPAREDARPTGKRPALVGRGY